MPMPRKKDEEKYCETCGKMLHRKRMPSGDLESNYHFHRRKYCDRKCMAESFEKKPKKDNPSWMTAHYHARKICPPGPCTVCGKEGRTDVHHRNGDWQDNRPENLMRLCRGCHLRAHREESSISFAD